MPTATASVSPAPEGVTGIVQTIVVEQPRLDALADNTHITGGNRTGGNSTGGNNTDANVTGVGTDTNVTVKILRSGSKVVPLAEGSLPTTKDGTTVVVTWSSRKAPPLNRP